MWFRPRIFLLVLGPGTCALSFPSYLYSLSRKGRRSCQLVRLTPSREWIIEIKSSGGLATRNDIGAGLAVGCHNIVPRLAAIVRPFDSFLLSPSLSDKGYRYWSLEERIGQRRKPSKKFASSYRANSLSAARSRIV